MNAADIVRDIRRVMNEIGHAPSFSQYAKSGGNFTAAQINLEFGSYITALRAAGELKEAVEKSEPKILVFDIETAPLISYTWGVWEQNVGMNQIKSDWHLLSWAAKWFKAPPPSKIMYMDQRRAKNIEDDRAILKGLWKLLDEAHVVITQNGKAFDSKKVNARFVLNGMTPPSPYKHIDTKQLAKKHFAFTSNGLEYMSDKLCTKYKKLKHKKFAGFDLWKECLAGNLEAWREMEKYNKHDVLATEELYTKLSPWGAGVDLNVYHDGAIFRCHCGSTDLERRGWAYTAVGKFQQYRCRECGAWVRNAGLGNNELSGKKRNSLKTIK